MPLSNDAIIQALAKDDRLAYLEEKVERLSRFQATKGEELSINVGTKKKPKFIKEYLVKETEE